MGACAHGLKALPGLQAAAGGRGRQSTQAQAGSGHHDWASHAADALRYAVTGFRPQGSAETRRAAPITTFLETLVRFFAVMQAQPDRDAVFHRMQAEGNTAVP